MPETAKNLLGLLREQAETSANAPATSHKVNGAWRETTWSDVRKQSLAVAAGFLRLGVQPGDRVAIFAATRQEWVITDLGALAVGACVVPIYSSNTAEEAQHVLSDSGATFCVVDNDNADGRQPGRLSRVKQAMASVPTLRKLVVIDGAGDGTAVPWQDFTRTPTAEELAEIERRSAAVDKDTLACLIYTSGTTGNPKGVELTHGNWVYQAKAARDIGLMFAGRERVLLFLPLAHSFAKVIEAAWLSLGYTLIFAESVDKVVDNCGESHPTVLPAVPRIFEKVYLKVAGDGAAAPGLQGRLFRATMSAFEDAAQAHFDGKPLPLRYLAMKRLVFPKIKGRLDARLGGNLRLFISGGAPLSRKLAFFFQELGFEILEGYGLTETAAAASVNPPGKVRLGTVGPALPGTEVRIAQDGEILIRGPGVMRGYYGKPEATREVLEPDGWFHSGDIGEIDAQGFVRITDRKKDIIVTAGGKNVAPQNLENDLKTSPIISQVMVHGDRRKFLSALVTINEEEGRKILTTKGISFSSYAELCQKGPIREAVDAAIQSLNATQPSFQTIKKYAVLTRDFSQETGELTPTLKVKRKVVTEAYRSLLDSFYDEKVME